MLKSNLVKILCSALSLTATNPPFRVTQPQVALLSQIASTVSLSCSSFAEPFNFFVRARARSSAMVFAMLPGAAPGVFMGSLFTPSGAEAGVVMGVEGTLGEAPGSRARLLEGAREEAPFAP